MFGAYDLGPLDNDPILNDANNGEPASRAHIIEPESRRRTKIAERNARGQDTVYMFDIYLHGEQETVFFDV